jgi:hypothetical protein
MHDTRPVCKYEPSCYRHSEDHLKQYQHPSREPAAKPALPAGSPARGPVPVASAGAAATHHTPSTVSQHKSPGATTGATTLKQRTLFDMLAPKPQRTIFEPKQVAGCPSTGSGISSTSAPKVTVISDTPKKKRSRSPARELQPPVPSRPSEAAAPTPPATPPSASPGKGAKGPRIPLPPPRASPLAGSDPAVVFEMPYDIEELQAIAKAAHSVRPSDWLNAWRDTHGVVLCGPFTVMAGLSYASDAAKWTEQRGVRDPPEVQCCAVVTRSADRQRLCLFRDDPAELPSAVVSIAVTPATQLSDASNVEEGSGKMEIVGGSLASVLAGVIDNCGSMATVDLRKRFEHAKPDKHRVLKARQAKTVAKTQSGVGIVVPYNKKTELGYRDPMIERGRLVGMMQRVNREGRLPPKQQEELDEQLRFNDISNDECDFGLGLELGLDLLSQVDPSKGVNPVVMNTMRVLHLAYLMLGRDLFAHILQCSMARLSVQTLA